MHGMISKGLLPYVCSQQMLTTLFNVRIVNMLTLYRKLDDTWKRGYIDLLSDSDFNNNINHFISELITCPGAQVCPVPDDRITPFSTALTVAFDSPPDKGNYYPSVSGLRGCTSVVIIGEKGCWISHMWESPWIMGHTGNPNAGVANFQTNILTPLENGNKDFPSPFAAGTNQAQRIPELADGEPGFKPEIRILSLQEDGSTYDYDTALTAIANALTGEGKAFAGCTVTRTDRLSLQVSFPLPNLLWSLET